MWWILLTGIRNYVNLSNLTYHGLMQGLVEIRVRTEIVDFTSFYDSSLSF